MSHDVFSFACISHSFDWRVLGAGRVSGKTPVCDRRQVITLSFLIPKPALTVPTFQTCCEAPLGSPFQSTWGRVCYLEGFSKCEFPSLQFAFLLFSKCWIRKKGTEKGLGLFTRGLFPGPWPLPPRPPDTWPTVLVSCLFVCVGLVWTWLGPGDALGSVA